MIVEIFADHQGISGRLYLSPFKLLFKLFKLQNVPPRSLATVGIYFVCIAKMESLIVKALNVPYGLASWHLGLFLFAVLSHGKMAEQISNNLFYKNT